MRRQDDGTIALIITGIIGAVVCFVLLLALPATAQDTAPAWEYAALAYDGNSAFAFTPDLAANNEINKVYDAMTDDELNAVYALNVMGERGWEYIDYQPGTPVVYLFKRLK